MTQEEKLEEAKRLYETANTDQKYVLERLFPELRESEDERIRRQTLKVLNYYKDEEKSEGRMPTEIDECIAWLEKQGEKKSLDDIAKEVTKDKDAAIPFLKSTGIMNENGELADEYKIEQGEQKPAWSEEDEKILSNIIKDFVHPWNEYIPDRIEDEIKWLKNKLKSLKDRVQPQPNQKWSEEDENHVKSILSTIECCKAQFPNAQAVVEAYNADIEWLNSIRPQNRWKPSDEQMKALLSKLPVIKGSGDKVQDILESLYQDLKKLREE